MKLEYKCKYVSIIKENHTQTHTETHMNTHTQADTKLNYSRERSLCAKCSTIRDKMDDN